jgi:hypothetical protein
LGTICEWPPWRNSLRLSACGSDGEKSGTRSSARSSDPMHAGRVSSSNARVIGYYCDNYLRLTKESGEFLDVPY